MHNTRLPRTKYEPVKNARGSGISSSGQVVYRLRKALAGMLETQHRAGGNSSTSLNCRSNTENRLRRHFVGGRRGGIPVVSSISRESGSKMIRRSSSNNISRGRGDRHRSYRPCHFHPAAARAYVATTEVYGLVRERWNKFGGFLL